MVFAPSSWGRLRSSGNRTGWPATARRAGSTAGGLGLLLFHDDVAGEGVGLDDSLALAVRRLQPAARQAVLPPRGVLDGQVHLVAQLAAVRGVAELERALR